MKYVCIGKLQPSTATLCGTDNVRNQSQCVQMNWAETIEMTRPDAKWRRSTLQCVRLSVPISEWSQQPYVVSVSVCLSQDWFSNAVSSVVLFIVYFESAVYAECLSVAWTFIDVWSIIWSTHVNHLKYICEVISSWKRSLIGSHRRKKGNWDMSSDCFDPCARRYVVWRSISSVILL